MQGLSDDQRIDTLEKKIDEGFAEMRAEFKAVRTEMHTEITGVERGLRTEIQGFEKGLRTEIQDCEKGLRTEIQDCEKGLRTEIIAAQDNARADFRTLIAILLPMYLTIILGFAALLFRQHL
jgi:CHASE3 domain sensor protein